MSKSNISEPTIYMIGGAPRAGKSLLGQQIAAELNIGWVSTDALFDLLKESKIEGTHKVWDARPEAIASHADWFFPYLKSFILSISRLSGSGSYLIEGVSFLPQHVASLSDDFNVKALFLGRSSFNLEQLDQFPGRSLGYSFLPENDRQQIADDVPQWSRFILGEATQHSLPYVDMSGSFDKQFAAAKQILIG